MTEQTAKGCGVIRVDAELWPDLGKPETNDAWHAALLLPEDYEVERIEQQNYPGLYGDSFTVFVQHVDIPIVPASEPRLPTISLHHRTEEAETTKKAFPDHLEIITTKKVFLDRIEIWAWQDDQWKQVK